MKLTGRDVGNLISALDLAIDYTESLRRSFLPPRRDRDDAPDSEKERNGDAHLLFFRSLRRRLRRAEA
jgi:hypothetical protein